ncbi:hypothetical protein [Xanthomonas nasturtii]|uniref:hypothetical protein n=1 Tax=Xanthomonas nasturtii TaxID=1843581 RepID=UPI002010FB55|nr:hypothetical protein [Xanthomonas nasturtii]MCL1532211.1 hypothetical protein [Xanthomonas nasturtii]MCL1567444.1 hypothetical protein [Xanthomonas nasturtii]WVL52848.1 hypothetical protein M3O59_020680 [Xanthomonas nasturtii]
MKSLFTPSVHRQQPHAAVKDRCDAKVDAQRQRDDHSPDPDSPLGRRPPDRKKSNRPNAKPKKDLLQKFCFSAGASTSRTSSRASGDRMPPEASPRAGVDASHLAGEKHAQAPTRQATLGQRPASGAEVPRKRKTLKELFEETKEMHEADAPLVVFSGGIHTPASSVQAHIRGVGGNSTRSEIEEIDEPRENTVAPERLATIEEESNEELREAEQGDSIKPNGEILIPWAKDANPKNLFWQKIDEYHKQEIFNLFSENDELNGVEIYEKIRAAENSGDSPVVSQDRKNHTIGSSSGKSNLHKKLELMEEMEAYLLEHHQTNDLRKPPKTLEISEELENFIRNSQAQLHELTRKSQEESTSAALDWKSSPGSPKPPQDYFQNRSNLSSPDLEHFEFAEGPTSPTSDHFLEKTQAAYEKAVEIASHKERLVRQARPLHKPSPSRFMKWLRG